MGESLGPGTAAALLVGDWESDSVLLMGSCEGSLEECCMDEYSSNRSSYIFADTGRVGEVREFGMWLLPWVPKSALPLGDVQLRNAPSGHGLLFSNQTGSACFVATPVVADGAQEAEELVITYVAQLVATRFSFQHPVARVDFFCDRDAYFFFNHSGCREGRRVVSLAAEGMELTGVPPFHDGRVMIVSKRLRRTRPPETLPCTGTATTTITMAALPSAQAGPATDAAEASWIIAAFLPASLGAAAGAACLVALLALCCLRRRWAARSRHRASVAGLGACGLPQAGPAAADSRAAPQVLGLSVAQRGGGEAAVVDLSENCLNGELPLRDFARKRHVLLQPGAISRREADGDVAGGLTGRGLLHGTTEVGLKDLCVNSAEARAAAINEIRIWQRARHQNIVLFHGTVVEDQGVQIVLEWIRGCSLDAYVLERRSSGAFVEQAATGAMMHEHRLLVDVARAMQHLHSLLPAVFHRGLRPSSILVQELKPPRGKVSDFSASCIDTEARVTVPTSLTEDQGWRACAAPELLEGEGLGARADVFAFGRVALFAIMAELASPADCDGVDRCGSIGSLAHVLPLVMLCLKAAPEDRPSFERIYWGFLEADAGDERGRQERL